MDEIPAESETDVVIILGTPLADVPLPHHPDRRPLAALLAHLEELPPAQDLDDGLVDMGLVGIGW